MRLMRLRNDLLSEARNEQNAIKDLIDEKLDNRMKELMKIKRNYFMDNKDPILNYN